MFEFTHPNLRREETMAQGKVLRRRLWGCMIVTGVLGAAAVGWAQRRADPAPASGPVAAAVQDLVDTAMRALLSYSDERWHAGDHPACARAQLLATVLDPHYEDGYLTAAWLLWSLGDDTAALEVYEVGMKNNPTSGPFFAAVAFHYFNTQRYGKARELLRQAFELDHDPHDLLLLGHSYRKEGRLQEALEVYEDVLRQFPDNAIAANNVSLTREKLGLR